MQAASQRARRSLLCAQHQVIAGPRDDPHETLDIHLRQNSAIGGRTFTVPRPQC